MMETNRDFPSVSIIIPAYNEEGYIEKCVQNVESELKGMVRDFEIIIVDDASQDKTEEILVELKKSRPYLRVFRNEKNRGLGGSLKTGFSMAEKEVSFYSDADLPFDFRELERGLRVMRLKDADVVTGFRHDRTSEGWIRILYSFLYNVLIRIVFRILVRDVNFSFKLIRTEAVKKMNLRSEGSFIDAEIMTKADRMNLFVCQIGIDYFKRKYGHSNLSSFKTIFKIMKEMIVLYPSLWKK